MAPKDFNFRFVSPYDPKHTGKKMAEPAQTATEVVASRSGRFRDSGVFAESSHREAVASATAASSRSRPRAAAVPLTLHIWKRGWRSTFALGGSPSGVKVEDVIGAVKDLFEENKGLTHAFALNEFLEAYAEEVKEESEARKKKGLN